MSKPPPALFPFERDDAPPLQAEPPAPVRTPELLPGTRLLAAKAREHADQVGAAGYELGLALRETSTTADLAAVLADLEARATETAALARAASRNLLTRRRRRPAKRLAA